MTEQNEGPLRSSGFAKLDAGIVDSTLWMKDHDVLRVWIALLAKSDALGLVRASAPAMAHLCLITLERFNVIIAELCAPDEYSRTSDHDGRRLKVIEGGWMITNYLRYRELSQRKYGSHADRQSKYRQRLRERDASHVTRDITASPSITRDTDVEADVEAEKRPTAAEPPTEFAAAWSAYPKRSGDNPKRAALRSWDARLKEGHLAAEMRAGVDRYAMWCEATGKGGTETVMQAKRFFGPDKPFLNAWATAGAKAAPRTFSAAELEQ